MNLPINRKIKDRYALAVKLIKQGDYESASEVIMSLCADYGWTLELVGIQASLDMVSFFDDTIGGGLFETPEELDEYLKEYENIRTHHN